MKKYNVEFKVEQIYDVEVETEVKESSPVFEQDIFDQLDFHSFKEKFDIIFIDPPYKEKNLHELLKKMITSSILKEEGMFIIHRHKIKKNEFPDNFNVIEQKTYGISKIIFGCCI